MAKGQKHYTDEFKNTIVELHSSGKTIAALSSEYGISKSTIVGWTNKSKPVVVEKDKFVTSADYQTMLKRMAQLEEENEILKKAMAIFTKK